MTSTSKTKRNATLGVVGGLLAGGAIGLVATVPSITSAAAEEPAQATTDDTTEESVEPGTRLRETLQPLVDDGTINDGQADAVTDHLVENRPERDGRGHRGHRGHHGKGGAEVAELLGIDAETLREELRAGSTLADIAETQGVDVQTVIDAMVANAEERIDAAIERGLDETEAAERLAEITEKIEDKVNGTTD